MSLSYTISEIQRDVGRKSPIWTYPNSIWRRCRGDPVGISPRFLASKTVTGLSYGVVCVIIRLAVLFQSRLVTDRQRWTDRQTQDESVYRASIESRGKNITCRCLTLFIHDWTILSLGIKADVIPERPIIVAFYVKYNSDHCPNITATATYMFYEDLFVTSLVKDGWTA